MKMSQKASLYRAEKWQDSIGRWHCADTSDLANNSAWWGNMCAVLDLRPTELIKLLAYEYKASHFSYNRDRNVLLFSWDEDKEYYCNKFKLYINKIAREKGAGRISSMG